MYKPGHIFAHNFANHRPLGLGKTQTKSLGKLKAQGYSSFD